MVVTEERRKKDEQGEMERIRRSLQHEENRRKILEQRELQRLELGIKAELSKNNQSLAQKTMQPLTEELMRRLAIDRVRVFSSDDVGYQSGFGTKNYWSKLGFQVTGIPIGFLVRDRMVYSIYDRWSLVAKKANMTVKQLKKKLLKKYKTEELLFANALRIANRLQKVNRISIFYEIINKWIQANQSKLTDGKLVRHEKNECFCCGGTGMLLYEIEYKECDACCGSGSTRNQRLYEHNFNIDGHDFCFHSYIEPDKLSAEEGDDIVEWRAFSKDDLPLPPQQLLLELLKGSKKHMMLLLVAYGMKMLSIPLIS